MSFLQVVGIQRGTALHKLHYPHKADTVKTLPSQINAGAIKPILSRLGEVLDFLPVVKQRRYNNTMLFRMESNTACCTTRKN